MKLRKPCFQMQIAALIGSGPSQPDKICQKIVFRKIAPLKIREIVLKGPHRCNHMSTRLTSLLARKSFLVTPQNCAMSLIRAKSAISPET